MLYFLTCGKYRNEASVSVSELKSQTWKDSCSLFGAELWLMLNVFEGVLLNTSRCCMPHSGKQDKPIKNYRNETENVLQNPWLHMQRYCKSFCIKTNTSVEFGVFSTVEMGFKNPHSFIRFLSL